MKTPSLIATITLALTTQVYAQDFDGRYHSPNTPLACDETQFLGLGTALEIDNNRVINIETQCDLANPVSAGRGTRFTATCYSEGETYNNETYLIIPTETGIMTVGNNWYVHEWVRCPTPTAPADIK